MVSERKKWSVNGSGRLDTVGVDRMDRLTVVDCVCGPVLTPAALPHWPLPMPLPCSTVGGSRHVASFAAAFYTFNSPLRDCRLALNSPRAGLFVIVTCAPVYRRVPPPCACRCQVRDGCTTSYDHGARVVSPANMPANG